MRILFASAILAIATLFGVATATAAGMSHKLAIHVDEDDPAVWNLALNNVENAMEYYKSQGDTVSIELVAYGPGLKMLLPDSAVKERISVMGLESEDVVFSACGNTMAKMSKKAGHEIKVLSEARVVPGGVIRLIELQNDGYAYLKP